MLSDLLRFDFNQTHFLYVFLPEKRLRLLQRINRHNLECANCASQWDAVIEKERRYNFIITSIIEAEVSNAIAERGIDVNYTHLYQQSLNASVHH